MIGLLCKIYRITVNIISVILLIAAAFAGYSIGDDIFYNGIGGIFIGIAVCFVIEVIVFAPAYILFSIDGRLEHLEKLGKQTAESEAGN